MARPRKVTAEPGISVEEMFGSIAEKIKKQAHEPNILGYKPHYKQMKFHKSPKKVRLYIGGNRSGKTMGAVAEDVWWLRGEHPYRKVPPPPIRARIVCVDFTYGIQQIIIPKLKQMLPPSLLKNGSWEDSYSKELKVLTLTNGSTVELMSYEQELDKFSGTSRHIIHFDEEPPKAIFNECAARVIDTDGDMWVSMTPVEGMTWVYDDLYLPGTKGSEDIEVIEVDMTENPYISKVAAERFLKGLDAGERKAREHGTFVQLGGLVYKKFNEETHVISEISFDSSWELYESMDHGYNNPSAWLWHAVHRDGTVVTFAEHYKSEMTVAEHVLKIREIRRGLWKESLITIGDPATQQRQGVTGVSIAETYAEHGVYIAPGNNDVLSGVNQVNSYLNINPNTGRPYWLITENCANLISEMQRLRWATWATKKGTFENNPHDKIHKKNDHACDAARYFFTIMPDLRPDSVTEIKEYTPAELAAKQRSAATVSYDSLLLKMQTNPKATPATQWTLYPGSETVALEYD